MVKSHAHCHFPTLSSPDTAALFLCVVSEIPSSETGLTQWAGKEKLYLPGFEPTVSVAPDCGHWSGPSQLASCSAPVPGPALSSQHHSGGGKSSICSQSHCWQDTRGTKAKGGNSQGGRGSWTAMANMIVLSPCGSKQTWPTKNLHPFWHWHSAHQLSPAKGQDYLGALQRRYQILLSLLQVLTQVLQGCCHSVHRELYMEILGLRNS